MGKKYESWIEALKNFFPKERKDLEKTCKIGIKLRTILGLKGRNSGYCSR